MTVRLLVHMYNSKDSAVFLSSLPAAGVSGTMKNYFRNEVFKGRVVAKTGINHRSKVICRLCHNPQRKDNGFHNDCNGFTVPGDRLPTGWKRSSKS